MFLPKLPFDLHVHVDIQGESSDSARSASPAESLHFTTEAQGKWVPVVSCEVSYSIHEFAQVVDGLVHFPERNSPLILRANIESDVDLTLPVNVNVHESVPGLQCYRPARLVHRLLCPRQPKRDRALQQSCVFYVRDGEPEQSAILNDQPPSVLVLSPELSKEHPTPPFYHPAVAHLAIRYVPKDDQNNSNGYVILEVVQLALDHELDEDHFPVRLVKTCISLLEGVHRVGYGFANGYRKRVDHDTLVDKAEFQDLYLKMKEMHGGLVETWQETTDPAKHVFEDIGIATFLILLWKSAYQGSTLPSEQSGQRFPWSHYARPPGGFRDIGCGNGLLTHILVASGYEGFGIDLRPRKSWANFGPETADRLRVEALDFTNLQYDPSTRAFTGLPKILDSDVGSGRGRVFLIGNHADELTPWMPLVAHAARADFINLPCCFWALDGRFHAQKRRDMPGPSCSAQPSEDELWELMLAERLHSVLGGTADANLGTKKGTKQPSQYGRYMLWLARLQRNCGYEVEVEALRIPSTRNWAFLGISRTWRTNDDLARVDEYVAQLVGQVRERGLFKTRVPEGKEGGFITLYGA